MSDRKINLNLGSGIHFKRGYINVDAFVDAEQVKAKKGLYKNAVWDNGAKFVQADICKMPFPDNYADSAEAHQVLEHLNFHAVIPAFKEIHRVLKKGGVFYFDVPDFNELCSNWLYEQTNNRPFTMERYHFYAEEFYGSQLHQGEFHHVPMTIPFLNFCFGTADFHEVSYMMYDRNVHITPRLREETHMKIKYPDYMRIADKFRCGTIFGKVVK